MTPALDGNGPHERALATYRRLVTLTLAATFLLVVIGGIVRVSDSGLGCGPAGSGTHGWPLCQGGVVPEASAASVVEYTHRISAGVVTVLIALLVWQALARLRAHRSLVVGSVSAAVLVLAQAGLGGLTVEHGLAEALVAAHLAIAMVLLGLLLVLRRWAAPTPAPAPGRRPALRALSVVAAVLVLATITTGGYVAGTEAQGTPDRPTGGQAHVACGIGWSTRVFPECVGSFPGFGHGRLADIQVTHRTFMYLAATAVLVMAATAVLGGSASPAFALAALLVLGQVALGILNVLIGKRAGLIVGHLTLGTLLWITVMYAYTTLLAVRAPSAERAPSRSRPAAAAQVRP